MTGTFRRRLAGRTAGRAGGCGPGTGCTSRRRGWTGPSDEDVVAVLRRVRFGAGPADRAADGPGRAAPRRGARAAPQRCPPAGGLQAAGVRDRPRAPARRPPGGQPERGGRQVAPAAGRAAGFPDGAGVRHLRVRADGRPGRGIGRLRVRELVPRPVGAPMRLDAVNELVAAAARRAGIDPPPRPASAAACVRLERPGCRRRRWTRPRICSVTPALPLRRCMLIRTRPGCAPRSMRCPARATWREQRHDRGGEDPCGPGSGAG